MKNELLGKIFKFKRKGITFTNPVSTNNTKTLLKLCVKLNKKYCFNFSFSFYYFKKYVRFYYY